ncbi:MAG: ubiquitin-like small modifier protein 1 [Acidimicrobiia bacterium]
MEVQVRLPTVLRPLAGGASVVTAQGTTVADVVADLEADHPGLGARLVDDEGVLHRFVNVFLGDQDIRYLDGLETEIEEGADITILPAVAGG